MHADNPDIFMQMPQKIPLHDAVTYCTFHNISCIYNSALYFTIYICIVSSYTKSYRKCSNLLHDYTNKHGKILWKNHGTPGLRGYEIRKKMDFGSSSSVCPEGRKRHSCQIRGVHKWSWDRFRFTWFTEPEYLTHTRTYARGKVCYRRGQRDESGLRTIMQLPSSALCDWQEVLMTMNSFREYVK